MIRRPPRSTRVRSSAASDVYKRQIIRLFFSAYSNTFCGENSRHKFISFALSTRSRGRLKTNTTRGKGGVSLTHHDGATTMNIGSVKRPTREEKRPILLSLLFICFLSVVAVFARISSSPPSSLVFIGKSSSASEDDDDDVNNNENTRNYDEEAEDEDAHFPRNGFRSARERGNDGTMRETLLRKCSRQRRFRRGREDDEEDADDEETQRGGQEQERRVQKSVSYTHLTLPTILRV